MKTIVDQFIQAARQYPDNVAVSDCEGSLTYRELDMRSNVMAHQMSSPYVLVLLPRRNSFLVAAYGAMKAGCCYVVVSPDYPSDRIAHIVSNSDAETIVTTEAIWKERQAELAPLFPPHVKIILIDQLCWDDEDSSPVNHCEPDKEAFVLYTSGTTGKPKGVVYSIEGITAVLDAFVDVLKLGRPIHDAVIADFCFLASPLTLFPATETGGTTFIASEEERMDMERLAEFLKNNKIDRTFMSGAMGKAMLSEYDLHFEMLLLGGERFPSMDASLLQKSKVYNLYGMTEGVPMGIYRAMGHEDVVPVGKTYSPEDLIYLLDPQGQPVAKGQMGEIFFSSRKIAKCYKNMPEQTAERFLPDPFRPGYRMVRTSDLGYMDASDNLVHCGRTDNMFKINGFRVEPGEVENVAIAFPGISNCACVKKELDGGDALCLFFEATEKIDTEALRSFMAKKLAHYMLPEFIVQLDELPRNARGKIDRKSMPDPKRTTAALMIAPVTPQEQTLFDIAKAYLNTDQFGVTDNLFTLGMTSLMAMKMAADALRQGLMVKATDIIRLKTIRKVLQEQMTMMRWYSDYDPSRETAVFTHGISITSNIQEKLKILSRRYNVFTIEPIHEHYHYIFQNEPMEEVIAFYYALMEVYMPADVRIAVFAGVSYGGKLAYLMACKHYENSGQKAAVILGDSLLQIGPAMAAIYKSGKMEEYQKAHHLPPFAEAMRERMFVTFEIDFYGEHLPAYDGKVILLHALKKKSPLDNSALWKAKASCLHIIPVDYSHDEICVDNPNTLPYWEKAVESSRCKERLRVGELCSGMRGVRCEETYIHRYIETAAQYPDRDAVVDADGRYTYQEIDHDSNLLAHRIVELTGGANEYVVIVLPKRALFTKSVLAVNRAGSAYVPLSADYPADRIDYIIKECQPAAVITTRGVWKEKAADGASCADEKLILLDDIDWKADAGEPVNLSTIDRRAMMIYTSGTTGRPKGVIHSFSSLTYMAERHQAFAKLPSYSTAMIADYTFIAAFSDSFGPLTVGGTIHLIDDSVRADLNRLNQYITDNHITRMFMGSQMGVTMLNMFDLTLRILLLGGEKATGIMPGRIGNVKVMNTYGMSEFNPVATHQIVDGETAPPIGKPYTDVECYILDTDGQRITEPGQVGELYVSGPMMSIGYFGMPELTAERYLDNPFKPGTKMFRTCDRVSLAENGELILCGRADNMFKLRGFRIEPGEVENVAMKFPGMGNCACMKKMVGGEETLCLYFEASETIATEALHKHLASTLAHYMVPDFLIQLDKLPRNARGKIDRKSMPDPDRKTELLMIAPESDDERKLFNIAASLLGKTEFGVTDNLFTVGMSSIMAMKMAAEALRQGLTVKGADIIRLKTIRSVIQENLQMVRFYRDYDPAKDTAIFMQGIMVASDTMKKLDMLAERYNVFVVEAIQEHYHYVFEEEPMAEVIELYYALADYYIPREAQVRLVVGMSFGGKLACLMAGKWQKERGQQPTVIMGDTVMVGVPAMGRAILAGELDKYIEENHLPKEVFNESFRQRITIVAQLENRGYKLPAYKGRVIQVHAQISTGAYEGDNLARWRRVIPQLEVVGVDYPHNIVCCDSPETLPTWKKLFSEIK